MAKNKRKRFPSLKSLYTCALRLCGQVVLTRDPVCRVCGEKPSKDPHHMLGKKRYKGVSCSPLAMMGTCKGCHIEVHQSPGIQAMALTPEEIEHLRVIRRGYQPVKMKRANLEVIIVGLEEMLSNLKTGKEVSAA